MEPYYMVTRYVSYQKEETPANFKYILIFIEPGIIEHSRLYIVVQMKYVWGSTKGEVKRTVLCWLEHKHSWNQKKEWHDSDMLWMKKYNNAGVSVLARWVFSFFFLIWLAWDLTAKRKWQHVCLATLWTASIVLEKSCDPVLKKGKCSPLVHRMSFTKNAALDSVPFFQSLGESLLCCYNTPYICQKRGLDETAS